MREPAHPPKKAFRLRNETFIRILLTAPRRKNSQKAAFATAILHIHAVFLQEKENIYAFYARKGGSGFVACTEQTVHLHRATGLPARSIHPAPAGEKTACRNVFPGCKHFAIPPSTSGLAASRFKKNPPHGSRAGNTRFSRIRICKKTDWRRRIPASGRNASTQSVTTVNTPVIQVYPSRKRTPTFARGTMAGHNL